MIFVVLFIVFFFKQKTAYEVRISDWSSDVCSSDLSSRRKALSKRSGGSGMAPAYSVTWPCPVKLHTRAVPAGTVDRERPASSFDRIPLLPCPGLARWRAFPLPETPETSMTSADTTPAPDSKFTDLGLPDSLLQALAAVGYESPVTIQAAPIPPLLAGRDMLGQSGRASCGGRGCQCGVLSVVRG